MDTCPRCGAVTATDTAFCTACGAVIHPHLSSSESEATLTQPPSSPRSGMPAPLTKWLGAPDASGGDIAPGQLVPDAAHTAPRKWRDEKAPWEMTVGSCVAIAPAKRFTVRRLLAAMVVLVAIAVVTVLAVAWRSEAAAHQAADRKLDHLSAQLAYVRSNLAQAKAIARKRRAVLLQAGATLGKVDPLLTRVDAVKSAAARDAQAYSAWANSLAVAYNYLNDSSYLSLDVAYLDLLISDANSRLTKADAADVVYERAVKAFGNNADSFTQSVRAMQRQLKSVTAP